MKLKLVVLLTACGNLCQQRSRSSAALQAAFITARQHIGDDDAHVGQLQVDPASQTSKCTQSGMSSALDSGIDGMYIDPHPWLLMPSLGMMPHHAQPLPGAVACSTASICPGQTGTGSPLSLLIACRSLARRALRSAPDKVPCVPGSSPLPAVKAWQHVTVDMQMRPLQGTHHIIWHGHVVLTQVV